MIASSHRNTSSANNPLYGVAPGSAEAGTDIWSHVSGVLNVEQVNQAVQQVALDYHLQVSSEKDARHISLTHPEESIDYNVVEIRWRLRPVSPPSTLPYQVHSETGLEVLITCKGTSMEESAIALGKLLESYVCPYSVAELESIVASMPLVLHYSSYDEALANWALIFRDHYLEHSVGFVLGMERAGIPAEWIFTLTKGIVHATATVYMQRS